MVYCLAVDGRILKIKDENESDMDGYTFIKNTKNSISRPQTVYSTEHSDISEYH